MKVTSTSLPQEEPIKENPEESMETEENDDTAQLQQSDNSEIDDFQHIDPVQDCQEKT
jgi:hypothetical protein